MESQNLDDSLHEPYHEPTVGQSLRHAWGVMWDNIGMILGLYVLVIIVGLPAMLASYSAPTFEDPSEVWPSLIAYYTSLPMLGSMLYSLLVSQPVSYGFGYSLIKGARNERMDVSDLFEGFKDYGNLLFGLLLTFLAAIVAFIPMMLAIFLMMLYFITSDPGSAPSFMVHSSFIADSSFIPDSSGVPIVLIVVVVYMVFLLVGMTIMLRVFFTPYLIIDQKLPAVEALKTSWKMTRGHTLTLFGFLIASIFICIGGLLFFIIGVIPAMIWVQTAYGSFYNAVLEPSS